jgi:predicted dinucleotide-binding enzyme
MPSKKVGIIGSGPVGQKLASAFSTLGYETKIGSRNPEKLKGLCRAKRRKDFVRNV